MTAVATPPPVTPPSTNTNDRVSHDFTLGLIAGLPSRRSQQRRAASAPSPWPTTLLQSRPPQPRPPRARSRAVTRAAPPRRTQAFFASPLATSPALQTPRAARAHPF